MTPARLESLYLTACRDLIAAEVHARKAFKPRDVTGFLAARVDVRLAYDVRAELAFQSVELRVTGKLYVRNPREESPGHRWAGAVFRFHDLGQRFAHWLARVDRVDRAEPLGMLFRHRHDAKRWVETGGRVDPTGKGVLMCGFGP